MLEADLFDRYCNESDYLSLQDKVTFIDLFAGVGGFHLAMKDLNGHCVFASEINPQAMKTYKANHRADWYAGDITKIKPETIPDHDILCAGFPCQPFSQAGFKKGFHDTRGTLFHDILNIIKAKRPKAYFLENVRHLRKHDNGRTFDVIKSCLESEGYSFFDFIVHAKDHGVPQLRPRLFMIGFRDHNEFDPPETTELMYTMSDIFSGHCPRDVGFTLRVGGVGSGIHSRHNWDSYWVDGKIHRLTVPEAAKMQGFPDNFIFPVSNREAMKQLGNSVAVPAVKDYLKKIMDYL